MTYASLLQTLESVTSEVYEIAAPKGAARYIAVNVYGARTVDGDDSSFVTFKKVQLDILCQSPSDTLTEDVFAALSYYGFSFTVEDEAYDPDYALMRCIVHLEVL